jgi:SAM-dependent methyltransferase
MNNPAPTGGETMPPAATAPKASVNRDIYNNNYSAGGLALNAERGYDAEMIRIRLQYIQEYGAGRDVLDLCCGGGAYLMPALPAVRSAVGLDFSRNLLKGFQQALGGAGADRLRLVEGDALRLPLGDNGFDFVFSYCSLYHIPRLDLALAEIGRVLRPGGYAALELGNSASLNHGWAKPFSVPYSDILGWLKAAGLETVEHRSLQIVPLYGVPRRLLFLLPFFHPRWKRLFGIKVRGRMLDEWISSSPLLRRLAFRQFFLVKKA